MTSALAVVDASAIIALLIGPESGGDEIAARLTGSQLAAPAHLPVEVVNVLRRRLNSNLLSKTEARLALDGFASLQIQLWPFETYADRVWELGPNLTAYDAAYVALAELLETSLITGDVRLTRAPGIQCEIELFAV